MLKFVFTVVCIGAALADHGPHFRAPFGPGPYAPAPAPYAPAPYVPEPPAYAPAPYVAPRPAYAPAPAPYLEPSRPFNYEYGVNDAYSGASFSKSENQVKLIINLYF